MASTYLDPPAPRVLAHRGLALDAPENTMLAFSEAVGIGASYLETDVHVSHDGVAVISHDPSLRRVAGHDLRVSDLTMDELRRIDLGHGQGYCALEEALDAFPQTRFNIDIKVEGALAPTVAVLRRTGAGSRVLLTSFTDGRRRRAARLVVDAVSSPGRAGVIRSMFAAPFGPAALAWAVRGAVALQVPERVGPLRVVTRAFVERAHRAGLEVHVWTVNDPAVMSRLLDLGVDGLVTDRADLALPLVEART
ncbi:MAG TPA: glycerophosphodiester phosphodiesterase family protein [Agromyces mariniharenae]|nr:glycerophosphodiester phosphodiesterase family protein [Agromyces mariniharenae]